MSESLNDAQLRAAHDTARTQSLISRVKWHVIRYRSGLISATDSDPHMIPGTRLATYALGTEVEHDNRYARRR